MSWWRSQRIALVALLVAAAAAFLVHLWLDVLNDPLPDEPTVVEAVDGRAEIAGHELELRAATRDAFDAPAGSHTVSVTLTAVPLAEPTGCGPLLLTEPSSGRAWIDASRDLDVPRDAGERYCLDDESASYRILAVFLVPDDASGPFLLDVPDDDGIARFSIAP